jgi:hypothetical protein
MSRKEILKAFWDSIPDDATYEDCNKGIDVKFTYKGKEYTVNTRLGNFYSMGLDEYREMIEQRAIDVVEALR